MFKFNLGEGFDFEKEFDNLIKQLMESKYIIKKDEKYYLTETGKKHVDKIFKDMKYHQKE